MLKTMKTSVNPLISIIKKPDNQLIITLLVISIIIQIYKYSLTKFITIPEKSLMEDSYNRGYFDGISGYLYLEKSAINYKRANVPYNTTDSINNKIKQDSLKFSNSIDSFNYKHSNKIQTFLNSLNK